MGSLPETLPPLSERRCGCDGLRGTTSFSLRSASTFELAQSPIYLSSHGGLRLRDDPVPGAGRELSRCVTCVNCMGTHRTVWELAIRACYGVVLRCRHALTTALGSGVGLFRFSLPLKGTKLFLQIHELDFQGFAGRLLMRLESHRCNGIQQWDGKNPAYGLE